MHHELKCTPEYFAAILSGKKQFECRINDRDFKVGDEVVLKEHEPTSQTYTGRDIWWRITYLMSSENHPAIAPGYCVFCGEEIPF